jgi:RimJ/RimL family protein N-acetyltransferase
VLGGTGLHPRVGAHALEIGYWMRSDAAHQGLATEAAGALAAVAFAIPGVERVEIRCDPKNVRSAAIPRRLGFRHLVTLEADASTPTGEPRDTMVWSLARR